MPRNVLITGAAGMVGSHLFEHLGAQGETAMGTYFRPTVDLEEVAGFETLVEMDVRYRGEVERLIRDRRPEVIYHLAAQSLPVRSWTSPEETIEVNVLGTVNLFEAVKAARAAGGGGYDPVVVVACSSAEYGASLTPERVPISEEAPLLPLHPYGVSKVGQDLLTYQYWVNDRIRGIRARIFNSTGPRKRNDVVSDFARRTARILQEGGGPLRVGNLSTRRAILDVRDLISALTLLAACGVPGEAYNICSDHLHTVGEIVGMLEKATGRRLETVVDPELLRPSDEPVIFGDKAKLAAATGWSQRITLEETVRTVLDYEVRRLRRRG